MKNERATMTVKETAAFIGVSMPTAYELVHSPGFPAFNIGKKLLVDREGLNDWMKEQQRKRSEV